MAGSAPPDPSVAGSGGEALLTPEEAEGPCPMDSRARALAWSHAKAGLLSQLISQRNYSKAMPAARYAVTSLQRLGFQKEPCFAQLLAVKAKCHKHMGDMALDEFEKVTRL